MTQPSKLLIWQKSEYRFANQTIWTLKDLDNNLIAAVMMKPRGSTFDYSYLIYDDSVKRYLDIFHTASTAEYCIEEIEKIVIGRGYRILNDKEKLLI